MNYEQKYFEEIFESMLEDSLNKGLISHAEEFEEYVKNQEDISNYYVMDKSVIAQMVASIYEDITKVYDSINVDVAEGVDLDNLGLLVKNLLIWVVELLYHQLMELLIGHLKRYIFLLMRTNVQYQQYLWSLVQKIRLLQEY